MVSGISAYWHPTKLDFGPSLFAKFKFATLVKSDVVLSLASCRASQVLSSCMRTDLLSKHADF